MNLKKSPTDINVAIARFCNFQECPNCDNVGYFTRPDTNGEPEMHQCQFCDQETSIFSAPNYFENLHHLHTAESFLNPNQQLDYITHILHGLNIGTIVSRMDLFRVANANIDIRLEALLKIIKPEWFIKI